jgi:hypothetical protein
MIAYFGACSGRYFPSQSVSIVLCVSISFDKTILPVRDAIFKEFTEEDWIELVGNCACLARGGRPRGCEYDPVVDRRTKELL